MFVGIDSLDIVRMQKFIQNTMFLEKYFTEYEINYTESTANKTQRLAGIYCAKEAFLKALGLGIGAGIDLKDIEVNHNSKGKPYIKLSDKAKKIILLYNVKEIEISITHSYNICTAVCVIL